MSTSEAGGTPPTQPAFSGRPPRPPKITARGIEDQPDDPEKIIFVPESVEVSELAMKLATKPFIIVGDLLELCQFKHPEDTIDFETAHIIATKYGYKALRITSGFWSSD